MKQLIINYINNECAFTNVGWYQFKKEYVGNDLNLSIWFKEKTTYKHITIKIDDYTSITAHGIIILKFKTTNDFNLFLKNNKNELNKLSIKKFKLVNITGIKLVNIKGIK